MQDIEVYIYDLRIIRWISWPLAAIFFVGWFYFLICELYLIYKRGMDEDDNDHKLYNVLNAIFVGYTVAFLAPTAISNFFICLKEPFMN